MRARAKYVVIYRHREQYPVLVMCQLFSVSRSGYYSFIKRLSRPEKDAALAQTIRQQQDKCFHTYGYRRMWQWLERNAGIRFLTYYYCIIFFSATQWLTGFFIIKPNHPAYLQIIYYSEKL